MQRLYTRKLNFQFRRPHYTKDSRRRKVIQNNQAKWLLTCNISINSLCFHSQSAVLQGRKVHPQRRLSVSTIKWLNLLKALSSCPFYCCCNHCLEKHTSALHELVCKSLKSSRKLCEQTCSCLLARWHLDHPGLTIPFSLSLPHSHFCPIWEFFPDFPLVCSSWDGSALSIICSTCSQNRLCGFGYY